MSVFYKAVNAGHFFFTDEENICSDEDGVLLARAKKTVDKMCKQPEIFRGKMELQFTITVERAYSEKSPLENLINKTY